MSFCGRLRRNNLRKDGGGRGFTAQLWRFSKKIYIEKQRQNSIKIPPTNHKQSSTSHAIKQQASSLMPPKLDRGKRVQLMQHVPQGVLVCSSGDRGRWRLRPGGVQPRPRAPDRPPLGPNPSELHALPPLCQLCRLCHLCHLCRLCRNPYLTPRAQRRRK